MNAIANITTLAFVRGLNGFGISYIELMAMLNKVNMFFNTLICR